MIDKSKYQLTPEGSYKSTAFQNPETIYKDKLPPLNVVEVRGTMDYTLYNKMKRDFVVEFPNAQAKLLGLSLT